MSVKYICIIINQFQPVTIELDDGIQDGRHGKITKIVKDYENCKINNFKYSRVTYQNVYYEN